MRPAAVEFLVHMSLCAAVASVNSLAEDGLIDRGLGAVGGGVAPLVQQQDGKNVQQNSTSNRTSPTTSDNSRSVLSKSDHAGAPDDAKAGIRYHRADHTSITGASLELQWRQMQNVEYLTDGGNSWIHTAVFNGKPVVVKTLKPECQDLALAINEIEAELCKFCGILHQHVALRHSADL
jgi:hypothetical protein